MAHNPFDGNTSPTASRTNYRYTALETRHSPSRLTYTDVTTGHALWRHLSSLRSSDRTYFSLSVAHFSNGNIYSRYGSTPGHRQGFHGTYGLYTSSATSARPLTPSNHDGGTYSWRFYNSSWAETSRQRSSKSTPLGATFYGSVKTHHSGALCFAWYFIVNAYRENNGAASRA